MMRRQQLKSAMLPIAMAGGVIFYKWMGYLTFLSPYLIFMMLFITYCKLNVRDLKPHRGQMLLLLVQIALAAAVYFLIAPFNHTVAEGVFICVFIPTATAAPVITSMLGGSISFVATYSLLCNTVVAIAGPVVLAAIGDNSGMTLWQSTLVILSKVAPLLLLPMIAAFIFRKLSPKLHKRVTEHQELSFYMWAVSLFIIVGSCVSFIINHWQENEASNVAWLAAGALAVCLLQYLIGRRVGGVIASDAQRVPGEESKSGPDMRVSAAQSLMQKNTVLGVWLAMAYMNPIASVAPAAYIAWHNLVNSLQIARRK